MHRVLDIDLDFFVDDPVYWPDADYRPDPEDHPVWPTKDAFTFLRDRCGLGSPLPGFVTENHGELFPLWRTAIAEGRLEPPFHVTHVDAHADLGLGDAGWVYLLTELVWRPPENRQYPATGPQGLNDANHLAFAVGCRWVADLIYVHGAGARGPDGGEDELAVVMEGFDSKAAHVQLGTLSKQQVDDYLYRHEIPVPGHLEPPVPYRSVHWKRFHANGPFDYICLTRSPPYTPVTADALFDAILETFVDPDP